MLVLGLDIGTTTVSAVVVEDGRVLCAKTLKNDSFLTDRPSWERAQDATRIAQLATGVAAELLETYPAVSRIGLTGQQHGIVYVNADGIAISPLYTWQDGRGELPYRDGKSYAAYLGEKTGYPLATGYGLVTHFYNLQNGLVPEEAVTFCTIHDYIAMRLCGNAVPQLDASDAASFGIFDLKNNRFDCAALERAGINTAILPQLAATACIGTTPDGRSVYTAIGDNQASFLGATGGTPHAMLVNIGTGSQFSIHVDTPLQVKGLELRPFPGSGWLLVGSSLCGGRAYALLEQFFRKTVLLCTGTEPDSCYAAMTEALSTLPKPTQLPTLVPLFQGTREDSSRLASVSGLSTENFDPLSLIYAMLHGMTDELFGMYRCLDAAPADAKLYGSGNGLRKNPTLRSIVAQSFGQALTLPANEEEAALGAALFAAAN